MFYDALFILLLSHTIGAMALKLKPYHWMWLNYLLVNWGGSTTSNPSI